jgi:hypothetical protein
MRADTLISFSLMLVSVWLYTLTAEFPEEARTFPRLLLVLTFALAAVILVMSLRGKTEVKIKISFKSVNWRPYITYAAIVLYVLAMSILGFFVSTACFLLLMMFYLGIRKTTDYLLAISSVLVFFYLLFVQFLHVPLPHGFIF